MQRISCKTFIQSNITSENTKFLAFHTVAFIFDIVKALMFSEIALVGSFSRQAQISVIIYFFLSCTMTNKCTIISQIITLLHVSKLSCHPQGTFNKYLAKLHKYFECSFW